MKKPETLVREILAPADIQVNGTRPWDITVHNQGLYHRLLRDGVLGLGESYMDEWWDCEKLDEFIYRVLKADLEHAVSPLKLVLPVLKAKLINEQKMEKAAKDVGSHYNRGNVLFRSMFDPYMQYSCGYWRNAETLEAAQEAKLDLICRKIGLKPGMSVLDIGCGWGGFLKFAAEKYGATGVGITLSEEQLAFAKEFCAGLPVEFRLQDYRELDSVYDVVVSIGMVEHVGRANYKTFMKTVSNVVKEDGLFLLHTIGSHSVRNSTVDPWMERYVYPGSYLPTIQQIAGAAEGCFVIEDLHNFGSDYAATIHAWYDNFVSSWDEELAKLYDRRFYRLWTYWMLMLVGGFRARRNHLFQFVLSKQGVPGGYTSIR